ncbi:pentapeptide repeat-containing protein [Azospirillum halopraeferens]|uniref:pentapeptide repeat-containing protein n=1 Tax=Azospirillum halopraeferens TaxID=34010 RepID=UPI00041F4665|nr:pentapeptide repeat-containing protein [Azospirillum halopraeferens]
MPLAVERGALVTGLLKMLAHSVPGNWAEVVTGGIDTLHAVSRTGPTAPTAEEGARLLLRRAAFAAAMRTIARFARQAPALAALAAPPEMAAELDGLVHDDGATVELTADAFAHPERWPALDVLAAAFARWQAACAVPEEERAPMGRAFCDEVPLALQSELRDGSRRADYAALLVELARETPVDGAAERARQWMAYRARLVAAVHEPLRSLAPEIPPYSLADLYVPLRAAIGRAAPPRPGGEEPKRAIVWLDEALHGWIDRADREDSIRVLSGDPGAGKSSACAMLAADLARRGRRVLLVPLGRLDYYGDPRAELSRFVGEDLGHDPLADLRGGTEEPLVMILDGLDELAKAGQGAAEIVRDFANSLERRVLEVNRDAARLLLLLAGRPGAAGATDGIARAGHTRLDALRYVLSDREKHRFEAGPLRDLDQRGEWWRRFDSSHGLPRVLSGGDHRLDDLTAQPLLNWLLAQVLTLEGPEKAATIDGVHDLYTRLFTHVLDRVHRERRAEAMDGLGDRDALERVLEEAAVAAWHHGDRAAPVDAVVARLDEAGLTGGLDAITNNRTRALTTVLDSFFCRAHNDVRHTIVEFTHKSFAEFLTARRIARGIGEVHEQAGEGHQRRRIDAALMTWMDLCGPAAIDRDLMVMVQAEVAAPARSGRPKPVAAWRRTLTRLFRECVSEGMPWPGSADIRARAAERRVRNAEVALLVALNATVRKTRADGDRSLVRIDWSATSAAETLHRLIGPWGSQTVAARALTAFDLNRANLARASLSGADLTGADLTGADLTGANLFFAYLFCAKLSGADLSSAELSDAKLSGANLTRANLTRAKLSDADLTVAKLSDADMSGADLYGANLSGANLSGANLTRANLTRANLTDANLVGANLVGASGIKQRT